jgi:hypothetical protein
MHDKNIVDYMLDFDQSSLFKHDVPSATLNLRKVKVTL